MASRAQKKPQPTEEIVVVGYTPHPLRDLYHLLLKSSWGLVLGLIVAAFLFINLCYALVYLEVGGLTNARSESFADVFFFSVQTFGTIGYGAIYPTSLAANLVVTSEAVIGLLFTALATGLVFQRFSQTQAMVNFSSRLVISPVDGVPTLMGRLGHDRGNVIVNAEFTLDLVRTVKTKEGSTIYRNTELELIKQRATSLNRTWTVMHIVNERSPLWGMTPERAVLEEVEAVLSVIGIDEITKQTVHARERYTTKDIVFGARLKDLLSEMPDGRLRLDLTDFDAIEATPASPTFPYQWGGLER